jgi:Domain of unknown function (DUF6532)
MSWCFCWQRQAAFRLALFPLCSYSQAVALLTATLWRWSFSNSIEFCSLYSSLWEFHNESIHGSNNTVVDWHGKKQLQELPRHVTRSHQQVAKSSLLLVSHVLRPPSAGLTPMTVTSFFAARLCMGTVGANWVMCWTGEFRWMGGRSKNWIDLQSLHDIYNILHNQGEIVHLQQYEHPCIATVINKAYFNGLNSDGCTHVKSFTPLMSIPIMCLSIIAVCLKACNACHWIYPQLINSTSK